MRPQWITDHACNPCWIYCSHGTTMSVMPQAAIHSTPGAHGCSPAAVCRLAWSESGRGVARGLHVGRCGIKPLAYQVDDGVPAGYVEAIPRNVTLWNSSAFQRLAGYLGVFSYPAYVMRAAPGSRTCAGGGLALTRGRRVPRKPRIPLNISESQQIRCGVCGSDIPHIPRTADCHR
jgi:hypothetical protein